MVYSNNSQFIIVKCFIGLGLICFLDFHHIFVLRVYINCFHVLGYFWKILFYWNPVSSLLFFYFWLSFIFLSFKNRLLLACSLSCLLHSFQSTFKYLFRKSFKKNAYKIERYLKYAWRNTRYFV